VELAHWLALHTVPVLAAVVVTMAVAVALLVDLADQAVVDHHS
jgi:hypothetical protein